MLYCDVQPIFMQHTDAITLYVVLWTWYHSLKNTGYPSSPSAPATSSQALYRLRRFSFIPYENRLCAHAAAPPFRKRSRSARLFACKRAHDGALSLPTFCGFLVSELMRYEHPDHVVAYFVSFATIFLLKIFSHSRRRLAPRKNCRHARLVALGSAPCLLTHSPSLHPPPAALGSFPLSAKGHARRVCSLINAIGIKKRGYRTAPSFVFYFNILFTRFWITAGS